MDILRIGVANTKGGVGKTTTAVYLASAIHERGLTVEVQDMDKQGSITSWLDQVEGHAPFRYSVANAYTINRPVNAEVVVIDTAPGDPADIEAVAAACDFVVVPSQPGGVNDSRTAETVAFLSVRRVPFAVLLVAVKANTIASTTTRETLIDASPVFETEIPDRQEITRAFGTIPTELHGYDQVFTEIQKEVQS